MGGGPVYAAVRDALAVYEFVEGRAGFELLRSGDEIAFDHDAEDVAVAFCYLFCDFVADDGLAVVILAAVGVAAIDHDARVEAGVDHAPADFVYAGGVVIGGIAAAAEDDVGVAVAGGAKDGGLAVFGVAEEGMRDGGGEQGVDGYLHVAGRTVFESDGAGDAADQLTVALALGGAGADGSPGDEAGEVLRGDHVEELGAGGDAQLVEVEQQVAGEAQALIDLEGFVEKRVVDEALPADGGAGLLKVDAHDDAQIAPEFLDGGLEEAGVFDGGFGVMDGAGADEDEEARVSLGEDLRDVDAGIEDGGGGVFRDRTLLLQENRREDDFVGENPEIFNQGLHGHWFPAF